MLGADGASVPGHSVRTCATTSGGVPQTFGMAMSTRHIDR
jgi:hypothetical protein